jgi:hypothetical protein
MGLIINNFLLTTLSRSNRLLFHLTTCGCSFGVCISSNRKRDFGLNIDEVLSPRIPIEPLGKESVVSPKSNSLTSTLILRAACVLVSGAALGWLVGLSVSPVIQVVLTSVVSIVVGISSALAGLKDQENEQPNETTKVKRLAAHSFNPVPIMCMVIGLALGSSAGIYARSHNWLGTSTTSIASEWKDTGLSEQEIARRVFDSLYPKSAIPESQSVAIEPDKNKGSPQEAKSEVATTKSRTPKTVAETTQQRAQLGVLFTERSNQCKRLLNVEAEDELRREIASSNFDQLERLARSCRTLQCLTAGVKKTCAKYK